MLWRDGDRIIFEYDFANVTVIPIHSESDINRDIETAIRGWADVPHIQQVFKSDFEEYLIESAIDRQLAMEGGIFNYIRENPDNLPVLPMKDFTDMFEAHPHA